MLQGPTQIYSLYYILLYWHLWRLRPADDACAARCVASTSHPHPAHTTSQQNVGFCGHCMLPLESLNSSDTHTHIFVCRDASGTGMCNMRIHICMSVIIPSCTYPQAHRLHSSSFWGLPYRIRNMNPQKELQRSLQVYARIAHLTMSKISEALRSSSVPTCRVHAAFI